MPDDAVARVLVLVFQVDVLRARGCAAPGQVVGDGLAAEQGVGRGRR